MKTLILLVIAFVLSQQPVQCQATATVNISSQPLWGPVNYNYVEYYYLPEAEVYYYVPTSQFIYLDGGSWVNVPTLPANYNVDLFRTYKVVLNKPSPYLQHVVYSKKYVKYKKVHGKQYIIRDSRNKKYFVVKGHPGAGKANAAKPKGAKVAKVKASGASGSKGSKGKSKK